MPPAAFGFTPSIRCSCDAPLLHGLDSYTVRINQAMKDHSGGSTQ